MQLPTLFCHRAVKIMDSTPHCGPPPHYWAGSNRVNFGVRMRTGALRLIWSNPYFSRWIMFQTSRNSKRSLQKGQICLKCGLIKVGSTLLAWVRSSPDVIFVFVFSLLCHQKSDVWCNRRFSGHNLHTRGKGNEFECLERKMHTESRLWTVTLQDFMFFISDNWTNEKNVIPGNLRPFRQTRVLKFSASCISFSLVNHRITWQNCHNP